MDLSGLRRALLGRRLDRNTCTCVPVCVHVCACVPVCMFLCVHVPTYVCALWLYLCVPVSLCVCAREHGGNGDHGELTSPPMEDAPTKKTVVV